MTLSAGKHAVEAVVRSCLLHAVRFGLLTLVEFLLLTNLVKGDFSYSHF